MSVAIRYTSRTMRAAIMRGEEPSWLASHPRRSYVRQAYLSVPPWIDRAELRWLEWCRKAWCIATRREQVLAHIVPLNHESVCGLTVPWNIEIKPRECNAAEGNRWHPDQMRLPL